MKDSKEYSKKVQKLYRSLKSRYPKVQKITYDEPLDALVYALVSEHLSESESQSAIKRFNDYFIDLNDLRVSRPEEIVEMLGADIPVTRNIASVLIGALRAVFSKYNTVSLAALKKISKRPAKKFLEKMENTTGFVVDYCMLTSLQGHAIPLTKRMIEYLRNNQLVYPQADEQDIEGFLARQISAENAYEFYALLRQKSESSKTRKRKKPETKKKTTRKAKKQKSKK